MGDVPFRIGERIRSDQLVTWTYIGLSGKPGTDKHAVRRYRKGEWVLEIHATLNSKNPTYVTSIRTSAEDDRFWKDTRQRMMRNKRTTADE